jgi:hypothetical protein
VAITAIAIVSIVIALVLIGSLVFSGLVSLFGSAKVKTQDMTTTNFTSINISSGFNVQITQGASYKILVTANSNAFSRIQVTKNQNVLTIRLTPSLNFVPTTTLQADIVMPDLQALDLSGGSNGNASGFILSHDFSVTLSGGSTLRMDGKANNLSANCSGGSDLELSDFNVTNATVVFSGGSRGTINLDGTLNANLSGGSSLYYMGSPTLGNINTSGAAQISRLR